MLYCPSIELTVWIVIESSGAMSSRHVHAFCQSACLEAACMIIARICLHFLHALIGQLRG